MKKFWIQIFTLFVIIFISLMVTFNNNLGINFSSIGSSSGSQLKIGDNLISVEIADTADKRSKGLSGREVLASDSGMLFIFQKSDKYQFWMKGMLFPLDFVWINGDSVVDILPNIPIPQPNQPDNSLPVYESVSPSDKILEVNAGYAASHNIKIGDKVQLINSP